MRLGLKIIPGSVGLDGKRRPLGDNEPVSVVNSDVQIYDAQTGQQLNGVTRLTLDVAAEDVVKATLEVLPVEIDVFADVVRVIERTHREIPDRFVVETLRRILGHVSPSVVNELLASLNELRKHGVVVAEREQRERERDGGSEQANAKAKAASNDA